MNQPYHSHTTRMQRRQPTYRDFLVRMTQQLNWATLLQAVITVPLQMFLWQFYTQVAIDQVKVPAPQAAVNDLMPYTFLLAVAIFWLFRPGRFNALQTWVIFLPLLAALPLAHLLTQQETIILTVLPLALAAINLPWFGLRGFAGLVLFAGLVPLTLPVILFYQKTGMMTENFIISLLPLTLSYLFFMSPLFIVKNPRRAQVGLILGVILSLNIILTMGLSFTNLLALFIIGATWAIFIRLNLRPEYRFVMLTCLQTITMILLIQA